MSAKDDVRVDMTVVGSEEAIKRLRPLIDVHSVRRHVEVVQTAGDADYGLARALRAAPCRSVLLAPDGDVPPQQAAPGLTILDPITEQPVVVSIVPGEPAIQERLAMTVVRRGSRANVPGRVVVLGPREVRYAVIADRIEEAFEGSEERIQCERATADRVMASEIGGILKTGPDGVIYCGHASSRSLMAYGGLSALDLRAKEPTGLYVFLACLTCARPARIGVDDLCLTELVLRDGSAACAVGSVGLTDHALTLGVAVEVAKALMQSGSTGVDVAMAMARCTATDAGFRMVGDPLSTIFG